MFEVSYADAKTLRQHEKTVVKHILLISAEKELLQGPLDQFPQKRLVPPPSYLEQPDNNEIKDTLGERKVNPDGSLTLGRHYLFTTFKFQNSDKDLLALSKDVCRALGLSKGEYPGFHKEYANRLHIAPITDSSKLDALRQAGLAQDNDDVVECLSVRKAYIEFGAALIASGTRLTDDYWETLAKEQGLTSYHRVFRLPEKLISIIYKLKPSLADLTSTTTTETLPLSLSDFENPYLTVTEQPSAEIRQEYLANFSKGGPISFENDISLTGTAQKPQLMLLPGQNITGSLELSAQFRLPKYHSRYSFLQAGHLNAMNVPISKHKELEEAFNTTAPTTAASSGDAALDSPSSFSSQSAVTLTPSNNTINGLDNTPTTTTTSQKTKRRMLTGLIIDSDVYRNGIRKNDETELLLNSSSADAQSLATFNSNNPKLNIDGWKFGSLPVKITNTVDTVTYSQRGLPLYNEQPLIARLNALTPNEIKELEYIHGSVFLNTGLQTLRRARSNKWFKYWQYKSGCPINLKKSQVEIFKTKLIREPLDQVSVKSVYNEQSNTDEVYTTVRLPNANFLGNSNIKKFAPPYVSEPKP